MQTPLGDRLRSAREAAKLTQEAVAKHFGGIAISTVSRWETGDSEPGVDRIAELAALYKADPRALAFGEAPAASPVENDDADALGSSESGEHGTVDPEKRDAAGAA